MKLTINNRNIILFLGIILILGIVWLNQNRTREGLVDAPPPTTAASPPTTAASPPTTAASPKRAPTAAEMGALSNSFQAQMAAAGIPAPSEEDMMALTTQLTAIIDQEIAAISNSQDATEEAEQATPVQNTVAPATPFPDITFFKGAKFGDAFCPTYQGNPADLNNKCSLLTSDNCNATGCCIWVNGNKCVAGNATGPSPDSGLTQNDYTYYSHKYQCYGGCDAAGGGGSSSPGSGSSSSSAENSTDCRDNLRIVSTTCFNDLGARLNCNALTIPANSSGRTKGQLEGEYIVLENNKLDMTSAPSMNWGIFKNSLTTGAQNSPALCNDSNLITNAFNIVSTQGGGGGGGGGYGVGGSNSCGVYKKIVPIQCLNQFSLVTNCPSLGVPRNSGDYSGSKQMNIGGVMGTVKITNNKIDFSEFPDMTWGKFQSDMLDLIQGNPNVCSLAHDFTKPT